MNLEQYNTIQKIMGDTQVRDRVMRQLALDHPELVMRTHLQILDGDCYGEIIKLIENHAKKKAWVLYKDLTGVDSDEAHKAVELLDLQNNRRRKEPDWLPEIKALVDDNKKINAIKLWREYTGEGLKEAKAAVESYQAKWEAEHA